MLYTKINSFSHCIVSSRRLDPIRTFSNPAGLKIIKGQSGTNDDSKRRILYFTAKILRAMRIPFLVVSVYQLGYAKGIVDFARNPEGKTTELLKNAVLNGVVDMDDPDTRIYINKEGSQLVYAEEFSRRLIRKSKADNSIYFKSKEREAQARRIALVGERIVNAARLYVTEKLNKVIGEQKDHMPEELASDPDALHQALIIKNDEYAKWHAAKERMILGGKWKFVLLSSSVPNAFVSELAPATIFVTTSFVDTFIHNDDELGLILGHEVSHLIFGHNSEAVSIKTTLKTIEILLLSLDPTEGLISIFIIGLLNMIRISLERAHSRECEREADELGIKLAAMSCFDTKSGALVMKRMHDIEQGNWMIKDNSTLSNPDESFEERNVDEIQIGQGGFLDTHPPSSERYVDLISHSDSENATKYSDSHCSTIEDRFWTSLSLSRGIK